MTAETPATELTEVAEGLEVAAVLLRAVVDYWDGRPTAHHGDHIYADLRDVLTAIERDAEHNRRTVSTAPSGAEAALAPSAGPDEAGA